jgi:hypothetical protein
MSDLVTIEEALAYLEEPDDAGGELQRAIANVSEEICNVCGDRWSSEDRVEYCDGDGDALILQFAPVDTEETVTITDRTGDEVLDGDDFEVDGETGLVYVASDGVADGGLWEKGTRRYKVEYTGGFAAVPAAVRGAALGLLASRWDGRDPTLTNTTRGGVSKTRMDGWPQAVKLALMPYLLEEI